MEIIKLNFSFVKTFSSFSVSFSSGFSGMELGKEIHVEGIVAIVEKF